MNFTGERYTPDNFEKSDNISETHWMRYNFSLEYITEKCVLDIACGEAYTVQFILLENESNRL